MNKSVPEDSPVCKSSHTYQKKNVSKQKLYTQIKDTFCQFHGFWDNQTGGNVTKLLLYTYIF